MLGFDARAPFARNPHTYRRTTLALAVGAAIAAMATAADARITSIEITSRGLAFGGHSFDGVGQYERIVGIAHGEVSTTHLHNSVIVDIGLAAKNARGNVEYAHNFYILKP